MKSKKKNKKRFSVMSEVDKLHELYARINVMSELLGCSAGQMENINGYGLRCEFLAINEDLMTVSNNLQGKNSRL